jgi:hypothetical protein
MAAQAYVYGRPYNGMCEDQQDGYDSEAYASTHL